VLGRFLEISVHTQDIGESVSFYERLGFSQCPTGDTWSHPYGVLTDGRLVIGLHQYRFPSPALTFVRPEIARHAAQLEAAGFTLAFRRVEPDVFNEVGLRDPSGQMITILEARTYSPCERARDEHSACGHFTEYSIPTRDFARSRAFWDQVGFVVAEEEVESPYVHGVAMSDWLDLGFHRPRLSDRPLFVFDAGDLRATLATLESRGIRPSGELPGTLDPGHHALIESPEGLAFLLSSPDPSV
jgi:catechol 2,3-dioxygenase-like lactoylglutathione lyase family enzyme